MFYHNSSRVESMFYHNSSRVESKRSMLCSMSDRSMSLCSMSDSSMSSSARPSSRPLGDSEARGGEDDGGAGLVSVLDAAALVSGLVSDVGSGLDSVLDSGLDSVLDSAGLDSGSGLDSVFGSVLDSSLASAFFFRSLLRASSISRTCCRYSSRSPGTTWGSTGICIS